MNSASAGTTFPGDLCGLIKRHAGRRPHAPAILSSGHAPLNYDGLLSDQQLNYAQLRAIGVGREDRVALITANGPAAATAFLYLASACACAPLNPAYKIEELEFYLRDLGARWVATSHPSDSAVQAAARKLNLPVIRMIPEGASCRFEFTGIPAANDDGPPGEDDIALLLHTSGTTSRPKLVPLLHRNLCASAVHIAAGLALAPEDRCLNFMPLFHVHGLVAAVISSIGAGGSVVCTDGVYGSTFFQCLDEFAPTWYTAVPSMHMGILSRAKDHAGIIADRPMRFLRSCSSALSPRTLGELEETFQAPLVEAYGMTEAAHQMSSNPLPPAMRKPGSVGLPAGPEVAIMNASGDLLAREDEGEVVIRGPNVMPAYLDNPEANLSSFVDGWFRTGDIGRIDQDGYLFLSGRLKEIINRGGEKISPQEVDTALLEHPGVKQAISFAIPHVRLGEDIGAAVVVAPGSPETESELRRFAATRLSPFKVPRLIRFVSEIPKGPTGKPQRIGLAAKLGIGTIDENREDAAYQAPESPLEERICAIWEELLNCRPVGTSHSFLFLGGDSLLAAQMLERVREETGVNLSFADFLAQGTIASLVREIERFRAAETSAGPVVALRASGGKNPLIWAPGHDGILVGISQLARLLDSDQPVYALESPQPSAFPGEAWSIRSFVARYVEALQKRFPNRSLHLAGICFGGVIAFEIARQLERQGGEVASLILMDTLNPQWREGLGRWTRFAAVSGAIRERGSAHLNILWRMQPREAAAYFLGRARAFWADRSEKVELRRMCETVVPARSDVSLLRRMAVSKYQPEPYSGAITMIRVRGLRPNPPFMGWTEFAKGPVTLKAVDYCPRGMMAEPAVHQVARLINEAIG